MSEYPCSVFDEEMGPLESDRNALERIAMLSEVGLSLAQYRAYVAMRDYAPMGWQDANAAN